MRDPRRHQTLPGDGGAEEAVEVAAASELEAGDDLLSDGGAADDVAALEDGDGEAGSGKVSRGDQAVVAGADDQRVPFLGREVALGGGGAEGSSPQHWVQMIRVGFGSFLLCVSWRKR